MMVIARKPAIALGLIFSITLFSCSIPLFKSASNAVTDKSGDKQAKKSSKLSGILALQEGCEKGYYQVKLQGILDNASVQVESQTDSSGRFSLVAPAGQYLMLVTKDNCGSKDPVELYENTEHMLSVNVREIKSVDQFEKNWGRVPASILVLPNKK